MPDLDKIAGQFAEQRVLRRRQQLHMFLDEIKLYTQLLDELWEQRRELELLRSKADQFVKAIIGEQERYSPPLTPQEWTLLMEPREAEIAGATAREIIRRKW
jgi:hypothetical protein